MNQFFFKFSQIVYKQFVCDSPFQFENISDCPTRNDKQIELLTHTKEKVNIQQTKTFPQK